MSKNSDTLEEEDLQAYEQANMLFQGAFIISGNLRMAVTATGGATEFGKLAEPRAILRAKAQFRAKINRLVFQIIIAAIILAIVAFDQVCGAGWIY